jgi:hypothetical protein
MKKSQFAITFSALLIVACAGTETYEAKMARYKARTGENILVPEIKSANLQFNNPKSSRFPASLASSETSMTNKKLYFLSLYTQYESLKKISNNTTAPTLSICPSFHTGLVTYQEQHSSFENGAERKFSYKQTEMLNEQYVNTHPELYLPVTKEGTNPKVIDILLSNKDKMAESAIHELMQNALNIHLTKTYTELRELCDYGTSSNYYIYENLITHIKSTKFDPSVANMNTLLKTTLFSNRAIITSLSKDKKPQGRSIASEGLKIPFSEEVVARMKVPWVNDYFNYIQTK